MLTRVTVPRAGLSPCSGKLRQLVRPLRACRRDGLCSDQIGNGRVASFAVAEGHAPALRMIRTTAGGGDSVSSGEAPVGRSKGGSPPWELAMTDCAEACFFANSVPTSDATSCRGRSGSVDGFACQEFSAR
jgi:hypothetical protein